MQSMQVQVGGKPESRRYDAGSGLGMACSSVHAAAPQRPAATTSSSFVGIWCWCLCTATGTGIRMSSSSVNPLEGDDQIGAARHPSACIRTTPLSLHPRPCRCCQCRAAPSRTPLSWLAYSLGLMTGHKEALPLFPWVCAALHLYTTGRRQAFVGEDDEEERRHRERPTPWPGQFARPWPGPWPGQPAHLCCVRAHK
jgi:hypothetical protein